MAAELNQDFVTYAGDDVKPVFTVRDSSGTAIDISSVTEIVWSARRLLTDTSAAVSLSKTGGAITFVTTGADGKFQVAIPKATTALLSGWYAHIAAITDASGNVTTVAVGRMDVGPKPGWTYDASAIASVPLYQVRRMCGDVIKNDQQLTDSEVAFFLTTRASCEGAAAECCRAIAAQYSRKVDASSPGEIRTAYSTQAANYLRMAARLDARAEAIGSGLDPYAGGISIADKRTYDDDMDRVAPNFNVEMMDNTIPVASPGPETINSSPDNV